MPVFNEFDRFKPYQEGEAIQDMSLYTVEATGKHNLFFNKRNNLCYGLFLQLFLVGEEKENDMEAILWQLYEAKHMPHQLPSGQDRLDVCRGERARTSTSHTTA